MVLPIAPIERIAKKAGANRLAEDAKKALIETLEERAQLISRKALEVAKHAGRTTVKREDIELALKG